MNTNDFLFVNLSSRPPSCKARGYASSSARSHAARISHARLETQRKGIKHRQGHLPIEEEPYSALQGTENLLGVTAKQHKSKSHPNILRFRLYTPKKPQEKSQTKDDNELFPVQIGATALEPKVVALLSTSSLDPFMRPAIDLSVPDKHLLHFYLLKTPNEIFGSVPGPALAMIMEANLENISKNEIQVLWCLIAVESHEVSFQPTASARSISVLRRRARAYDMMQARVVEGSAHSDDFLVTLGLTAAIEKRIGNIQYSDYHTRALKKLIDHRGGLKAIREMNPVLALMVVNMLIEIGIPELYEYHSLLANLKKLRQKFQRLQDWNNGVRASVDRTKNGSTCTLGVPAKNNQPLAFLWWQAFNEAGLSRYIEIPSGELTEAEYRFYLAMLFFVNSAFWAFRNSNEAGKAYAEYLSSSATASKSTNFILQCFSAKLPSILLLILLAHQIADSTGRDSSTSAVFEVEELLDFVELMMLAKPKSRDLVLKALWSWLSCSSNNEINLLSVAQLDNVVKEIEDQWLDNEKEYLAREKIGARYR
ncbi:hypothetical protein LTR84_009849 [Exophiala bonariae]|uniref:ATPase synthesis protein 25 n=1 Tax=Exophiala bonariae TaxID=1690606 RepID=A0AAV9NNN0_9EURO|nr:hypothetical protein LTR84_009849 [Exophiala bonariae]